MLGGGAIKLAHALVRVGVTELFERDKAKNFFFRVFERPAAIQLCADERGVFVERPYRRVQKLHIVGGERLLFEPPQYVERRRVAVAVPRERAQKLGIRRAQKLLALARGVCKELVLFELRRQSVILFDFGYVVVRSFHACRRFR